MINSNDKITPPTILLADNKRKNRELMSEFLNQRNYKVLLASNGKEVLEKVSKEIPNLIFLEVNLPDVSGLEICKKLKASLETKDVPVIFFTKKASHNLIIKMFQSGGSDYILKPVLQLKLERKIEDYLVFEKARRECL